MYLKGINDRAISAIFDLKLYARTSYQTANIVGD